LAVLWEEQKSEEKSVRNAKISRTIEAVIAQGVRKEGQKGQVDSIEVREPENSENLAEENFPRSSQKSEDFSSVFQAVSEEKRERGGPKKKDINPKNPKNLISDVGRINKTQKKEINPENESALSDKDVVCAYCERQNVICDKQGLGMFQTLFLSGKELLEVAKCDVVSVEIDQKDQKNADLKNRSESFGKIPLHTLGAEDPAKRGKSAMIGHDAKKAGHRETIETHDWLTAVKGEKLEVAKVQPENRKSQNPSQKSVEFEDCSVELRFKKFGKTRIFGEKAKKEQVKVRTKRSDDHRLFYTYSPTKWVQTMSEIGAKAASEPPVDKDIILRSSGSESEPSEERTEKTEMSKEAVDTADTADVTDPDRTPASTPQPMIPRDSLASINVSDAGTAGVAGGREGEGVRQEEGESYVAMEVEEGGAEPAKGNPETPASKTTGEATASNYIPTQVRKNCLEMDQEECVASVLESENQPITVDDIVIFEGEKPRSERAQRPRRECALQKTVKLLQSDLLSCEKRNCSLQKEVIKLSVKLLSFEKKQKVIESQSSHQIDLLSKRLQALEHDRAQAKPQWHSKGRTQKPRRNTKRVHRQMAQLSQMGPLDPMGQSAGGTSHVYWQGQRIQAPVRQQAPQAQEQQMRGMVQGGAIYSTALNTMQLSQMGPPDPVGQSMGCGRQQAGYLLMEQPRQMSLQPQMPPQIRLQFQTKQQLGSTIPFLCDKQGPQTGQQSGGIWVEGQSTSSILSGF